MIISPVQQPMDISMNPVLKDQIKADEARLDYEKTRAAEPPPPPRNNVPPGMELLGSNFDKTV